MRGKYSKKHKSKNEHGGGAPTTGNNVHAGSSPAEAKPEAAEAKRSNDPPMKPFQKPDPFDVAIWGLIITFGIAVIYFYQLLAMRDTVEKMQNQIRLSVRPWVGLDDHLAEAIKNGPLHLDEKGNASLTYEITAKNYGTVPASNVISFPTLVITDDTSVVDEEEKIACGDSVIGKPDIGTMFFQGNGRVFSGTTSITKVKSRHGDGYMFSVWLAGCIGYRDQFGYLYRTHIHAYMVDSTGKEVSWRGEPKGPLDITGSFKIEGGRMDAGEIPKYNYGEGIYKDKNQN